MSPDDLVGLESNIARARVVLSLVSLLSIYVDPTTGGAFFIDAPALIALSLHLAYSTATYVLLARRVATERLPAISTALDVGFAVAVATLTEGATSPSFVFFGFAIIAVGCRGGFRATLTVTFASMLLYLSLILLAHRGAGHLYIMRPAYLGIVGYLIGFLGEQRMNFEARIRELETAAARHAIARSLHDGYVQALAGVNLRLETSRELISRGQSANALGELTELQAGVAREFDAVRAYVRSLADVARPENEMPARSSEPLCRVQTDFAVRGLLAEQILQIMLEGLRNALRHGGARSVALHASQRGAVLRIGIDDDGKGFAAPAGPPWSIASRVAEFGGQLKMAEDDRAGAHLDIVLPT